jgi:hypothetical protein
MRLASKRTGAVPRTVFLLGNGRSGTRFLCSLFRNNAARCTTVHEPYMVVGRPAMFGCSIYDWTHRDWESLRREFNKKRLGISTVNTEWYVETNHAFLKSFAELAIEAFPNMKLIHLIRDPLKSCASQVQRELFNHRYRVPYRIYTAPNGHRYYRWRLTGDEPIYGFFDSSELTLFQTFFVQWIEIENRAQSFLDRHQKRRDCFVLHSPSDLNDAATIREMFAFLGVPLRRPEISLAGVRNHTPGARASSDESLQAEMQQVIDRLPADYLAIFQREPYAKWDWAQRLGKQPRTSASQRRT